MAFENLFIRTNRTIGTASFEVKLDSVISEGHDNAVTITRNPVEAGADITDHAIIQPKILSMQAVITDTPLGTAAFSQLIDSVTSLFGSSTSNNSTRTQQAYDILLKLMEEREPMSVSTKLRTYNNMVLTSVKTVQDKDTSRAAFLDLVFEEIILTESQTSGLTLDNLGESVAQDASSVINSGTQLPTQVTESQNQTYLATLADFIGG